MAKPRPSDVLYPPESYVLAFHDTLIKQSGTSGYLWKDMVKGSVDWARTEVFCHVPYPGLLNKASALLYAYITFHPFVDGNKRTSLMTTSFFFFINGYTFRITDDSPEFTIGVAKRSADPRNPPEDEISRIAEWVKPRVSTSFLSTFLYRIIRNDLPPGAGPESLFSHPYWDRYYQVWRLSTTERFKHLLRKWPGSHSGL